MIKSGLKKQTEKAAVQRNEMENGCKMHRQLIGKKVAWEPCSMFDQTMGKSEIALFVLLLSYRNTIPQTI